MMILARLSACALVLLVSVAASCDNGTSPSEPKAKVPFTTLAQAGVPGQTGGELRQVIRDPQAWTEVWAKLQAGSGLSATPPEVDFHQDMVIVTAMPTQPCVSKVTVRSISGGGGNLQVDLLEEPSGGNCRCITAQRPFHVVRLPRSDAAVDFAVTVTPKVC